MLGDYSVIKGDPLVQETERLQSHVRHVLAQEDARPPVCDIEATWGFPVLRIVETALEHTVDLIVIGTRTPSGTERCRLGSVAEQTVRLAPCPVLVVPGPHEVAGDTRAPHPPRSVDDGSADDRVSSVMSAKPITIPPNESLETARHRMSAAKIRHLPVVASDRLVGILSDVDFPAYRGRFDDTRVDVAMTPEPVTIGPDASIEAAARLMLERRVRALPVVEGDRLIGMLSVTDILEDYVRVSRARS
jgi:CBS domain-containing protein